MLKKPTIIGILGLALAGCQTVAESQMQLKRAGSRTPARFGRRTARSQKFPARAVAGKMQKLEARLRQMVYAGEIDLDQARREIVGDWRKAYAK